jgi:hypothetical protein
VFLSQQFVPTFLRCILQVQLFDLLLLHGIQSNCIFDTSLVPPHENGVIWSNSRLEELPQHLHVPLSLEKTIFLVVSEIYLLCEKLEKLIKRSNMILNNLFILLFYI